MKLSSYLISLFLLVSTSSQAVTILELLSFTGSCRPVVLLPDSLFADKENVLVDLNAYLNDFDTSDSLVYTNQVALSNTSYFEYLGYLSFDQSDTLSSRHHAFRLVFDDFYKPLGAFTWLNIDLFYNNELVVSQWRIIKNCLSCNNCPNRFALNLLYSMLPAFTFGDAIPYSGYSGSFSTLASYQQQVLSQLLNWLLGTQQPDVADYLDAFDMSKKAQPLSAAFCSSGGAGLGCSCSQDLWQAATMIEPMLKMVYQNPEMFGGLLEQLQVAFMSNCFCAGSYSVYLHSNAEENGYSLHFMPFQQGLPTVQAELVFDNDSSYTAIAYSYGWPLDHGLAYTGNGTFDYLNGFEPLYHQGDTSYYFSTQATLPYDTLYAGFNTRVYVQPDTADRYKFYRNRSLNQDSTLSYSTYTGLNTADTLVVVTEISEASTLFTITCTNNNSQQPAVECDTISFPVNRCVSLNVLFGPTMNPLPGMYFRSRSSGPWSEGLSWQASHDSLFWFSSNAWPDERAKSILIRAGDTISLPAGFDSLAIAGHLNVQGQLRYDSLAVTNIIFTDTLNQAVTTADTLHIKRMTLNKGQNTHVFLNGQLAIEDSLSFVKGIVYPDSVSVVLFGDTAIAQGASDSSYVNGPVENRGNTEFVFPVGKNNYYRAIGISAPNTASDKFRAEFWEGNSGLIHSHDSTDVSLTALSRNEYWSLNRVNGTSIVSVKLSWDTLKTSCRFSTIGSLRVAGWDGATWADYGDNILTGTLGLGSLQSSESIDSYELFTLATTSIFKCNCNYLETTISFGGSVSREDELVEITASTTGYEKYKFYINDQLLQDSVLNIFLTYSIRNGDTVKVVMVRENECFTDKEQIFTMLPMDREDNIRKGRLWLVAVDSSKFPISYTSSLTSSDELNSVLVSNKVFSMRQTFPFAKSEYLRRVFELECVCNEEELLSDLDSLGTDYVRDLSKVYRPIPLFDPLDWGWGDYLNQHPDPDDFEGPLWYLKRIDAPGAWDITKGDPDIKVAVEDAGFDIRHPDLVGKIDPPYDFFTHRSLRTFDNDNDSHGNSVAGLLAARTKEFQYEEEGGMIPSLGFRTKIMAATGGKDLIKCLYASTALGARVLSISWTNGSQGNIISEVEKEILDNGTIIVRAAGNGEWAINDPIFNQLFNEPTNNWTKTNSSLGGTPANAAWTLHPDGFSNGNETFRTGNQTPNAQFYLSDNRVQGGGSTLTSLTTPSYSTEDYLKLKLVFYHYFNHFDGDNCKVQVSTNGSTWTDVSIYETDRGSSSSFVREEINLDSYIGNPIFYVRFVFTASNSSCWAIDDVYLRGAKEFEFTNNNQPMEPFSGVENGGRTIVVSSTYRNDEVLVYDGVNPLSRLQNSHYPAVDVCAPGLGGVLAPIVSDDNSTATYAQYGGTSQSAPLVAALAALILSVNSCLQSQDVEYIIKSTTDAIPDAGSYPGLYGTGRINAFKACSLAQIYGNIVPITENTTWTDYHYVNNELVILSGKTLTITGAEVHFSQQGSIVVEPGAKLVLDGCTLTSKCGMWRGIQLLGNPNAPQGTMSITLQGVVSMDGALIENAREGIMMGGFGDDYLSKTGGIIVAKNSTFRNNWRSVCFNPYNSIPISQFTNCFFISDSYLKAPEYYEGVAHPQGSHTFVTMWGVKTVRFTDNTFLNTTRFAFPEGWVSSKYSSYSGVNGNPYWPGEIVVLPGNARTVGIACYDGRPLLYATDISGGKRNKFIGLTYGIQTKQTGTSNIYFVQSEGSLFENTQIGIYSEKGPLDRFKYNTFNIPGAGTIQSIHWPNAQGIYEYHYRNFQAYHNTFERMNDSEGDRCWGLIARGRNTDTRLSLIERNDFDNMRYGFQAEASNLFIRLKCNTFEGNTRDWNINPITPGSFANQGVGCSPVNYRSGNKFNDQEPDKKHIWSKYSNHWLYYCRRDVQDENPVFDNLPVSGEKRECFGSLPNPCPSGTGARYDTDLHSLRRMHKAAMDTLTIQLEQLQDTLDRGNTFTLLNYISINEFDNSMLTPILVNHSPLSDTVLVELLTNRDPVLNDTQLLDIMSRNLPGSDTVMNALIELFVNHEYEAETRDSLFSLQHYNPYYITPSVLERNMAHEKTGWLEAIYGIEAAYMEDDEQAEITAFYKDTLGTGFERELFAAYMGADSLGDARALLDLFPVNTTDDSLFVVYHSLLLDLKEDTLSWKQLDSLQVLQVKAIASIESSVQDYALAVLEFIGDTVIVRFPEESTEESARYAFKEKEERKLPKLKKTQEVPFTIYPNPNSGLFTIELSEKTTGELRIQLTDLTGRVVFSSGYNEINTYLIGVDLSGLSKGVYLCSVFENNYIIGTQRVILIK